MTFKPLYWTFALLTLAGVVGLTLARGANARRAAAKRPNIIFVLTDDLAWNLVKYMPHVQQLQRAGHDVHELLRHRLAVLPVARVDLHRPVPARHGRSSPTVAMTAGSRSSTRAARRATRSPRASRVAATAPR